MAISGALLFALLLAIVWLVGSRYNHKHFPRQGGPLTWPDDFIIQIDDYGQFWDQSEPERALAQVKSLTATTNVIVVVYIHGWNHNAAPDDENLSEFASSVAFTRSRLIDPDKPESAVYRLSRQHLTGTEALTVVAIYIGWRGRSLPWIFNYATFWGRKAAAKSVGEGDLRVFLTRLNAIYKESQQHRAENQKQTFMGLISFGHSFGGQVLFQAAAYEIENALINRTQSQPDSKQKQAPITNLAGFGDLVVLVNPAFEAMQFERIWRLCQQLDFGLQQNPILLVVSSTNDKPRQWLFPIGRNLDALLLRSNFRPGQRALWTQALGVYEPFRTHMIDLVEKPTQLIPLFDPSVYLNDPCAIANLDLTNILSIAGVRLTPSARHKPNNPFVIAHVNKMVVKNHSEVFEQVLLDFLNDYIALAQGKRMLTTHHSINCHSQIDTETVL